ncbi:MAG: IS21 family transposase [Candidatus Acidiferrales bacterium]
MNRRTKVELFEQIRREYEHGGGTIRGIAKKLGIHRRLVREAVLSAVPAERKTPVRERPKLEAAKDFVEAILEADRKAPRKQRHTAHRIWCRIRAEMPGVEIGESTIRHYVRERKIELRLVSQEVFIPQSYSWGQEGQVDWYEAYADIGEERQKAYMFCMRSMASGGAFHCAFPHASQQAFLEAHERGFAYFGGVFKTLRYDNLRSAVKKILRGHQREETTRFIAFRSHWDFESEFCTPAEGHEKGGVEGEGGYFRRNHMVPVPKVASWEKLDALLLESSKEDEQRIIGERAQTVGAGMSLEQEHLKGLKEGFDLAAVHFPHVNTSGCVKVLTNFYSVPLPVGLEVQAKVHSAYVEIWHQGECVARHERCFNRQQKVLNLEHYLDALTKKPGAFAGSTALEQWRAQGRWPASFDRFWEALKQRRGKQAGTRAMIDVLLLGRSYGYPRLKEALEKSLDLSCFDAEAVRLLLTTDQAGKRAAGEAVEMGALRAYDRPQPTTRNYDQLLANCPSNGVIQ